MEDVVDSQSLDHHKYEPNDVHKCRQHRDLPHQLGPIIHHGGKEERGDGDGAKPEDEIFVLLDDSGDGAHHLEVNSFQGPRGGVDGDDHGVGGHEQTQAEGGVDAGVKHPMQAIPPRASLGHDDGSDTYGMVHECHQKISPRPHPQQQGTGGLT